MADVLLKKLPDYYFSKVKDVSEKDSLPHIHQALEIYYLMDGQCNYLVANHSYKVMPGDIILIPSGMIHSTIYNGKPRSRIVVNCSSEFIPANLIEHFSDTVLYRNTQASAIFTELFEKIEKEQSASDEYSNDLLKCYTHMLLMMMLRHPNEYHTKKDENNLVNKALSYLQQNYMNEVRLSTVAKAFSVSSEHLSRVFKKETGIGFNEYLTLFRLQKAEFILRTCPNKAISEVAYTCGFNDGNYFSYKFKEIYGVSPIKMKGKPFDRKSYLSYEDNE